MNVFFGGCFVENMLWEYDFCLEVFFGESEVGEDCGENKEEYLCVWDEVGFV